MCSNVYQCLDSIVGKANYFKVEEMAIYTADKVKIFVGLPLPLPGTFLSACKQCYFVKIKWL